MRTDPARLSFEIVGDPVDAETDSYQLTIEYSVPNSEDVSRLCTVWEDIERIIEADIAQLLPIRLGDG